MKGALPLLLVVALVAGCVSFPPGGTTRSPSTSLPSPDSPGAPASGVPVDLPQSKTASEPSLAIAPDGTIYVSAPTGLPSASPLWQSMDGGKTWQVLHPNAADSSAGPGLGGGDTSIAIAPDGSVYVTDLWAGSATISSSHDAGATWFTSPVSSEVPFYDREWNAVDKAGTPYFVGRTFAPGQAAWSSESLDGGKTWVARGNPWVSTDTSTEWQDGPLVANPKTGALGLVYTCGDSSQACVSISADQGLTWAPTVAARASGPVGNDFPSLAADAEGNWYVAYAVLSSSGTRVWMTSSPDGKTWSAPVPVSPASGNAVFPWIVAGAAGRVDVAWYGSTTPGSTNDATAMKDATWDVVVVESTDARSATPRFTTTTLTTAPMHKGTISTQGLDPTSAEAPDRSLGDFFTIALDPQGRVNVAYTRSIDGNVSIEWARAS